MHAKSFGWAAVVVALAGLANLAQAQMSSYGLDDYSDYGQGLQPASAMGAVDPSCTIPSCTTPTCTTACPPSCGYEGGYGCGDYCCQGYCNRFGVFADFLFLRARGNEVAYAVPIDGDIVDPDNSASALANQVGPVQTLNSDFQPGFRGGFSWVCDECSMIQATYSQLDSNSTNSVSLPGGSSPILRSLVTPFQTFNAVSDNLDGAARQDIQFKLADVDYKGLFAYCCDYRAAFVIGARYGELNQEFASQFSTIGNEFVFTNINFHGAGIRLGLEGERYGRNRQWFGYGRGMMNFLGGEFKADYQYFDVFADGAPVSTSWRAGRLVTIADLEVGLGWQNCCGNLRVSAGYMYSMWFNMVKTQEWINAVQNNNFVDPSGNFGGFMSFDGLTSRVEFLW